MCVCVCVCVYVCVCVCLCVCVCVTDGTVNETSHISERQGKEKESKFCSLTSKHKTKASNSQGIQAVCRQRCEVRP